MKVLVTAGVHGNEQFGLKVVGTLHEQLASIDAIIAHPEAVAKNVRFIETDLNRSFNGKNGSLEERIATSLVSRVKNIDPEIIIDVHTSVSDCGAVAIATSYTRQNHILATMCGMTCLVIMHTSNAFIEQFSVPSIALEFGRNLRSDKLSRQIAERIISISETGISNLTPNIPVYEMDSVIPKSYSKLTGIKNLEYDAVLKGFPFLAGPDTYDDIGGFLLRKKDVTTV